MYDLKDTINKYGEILELKKEKNMRDIIDSKIEDIKYHFFIFLIDLLGFRCSNRL